MSHLVWCSIIPFINVSTTALQVTTDTTVLAGWMRDSCFHGLVRRVELRRFKQFRQQVAQLGWDRWCVALYCR